MKRRLNIKSVLGASCIIALFACSKHIGDKDAANVSPSAVIVFSSPAQGANYHTGDSVSIQAKAIALNTVHGYDVRVKKINDTTTYFFKHVHDHNDTLYINQKWKIEPDISPNLEAEITLYIDHDGNTVVKKVGFKVE